MDNVLSLEKISKEMRDTLIHRECIIRSGQYLASYLASNNRSVDAIRLIGLCSVHDMSKIQNAQEFMSLASIVDGIHNMQDENHVLDDKEKEAIKIHWKNNSHHAEYYNNPNDMTDMDLMEMACDCHARSKQYKTNLLEYIDNQQVLRFHFDNEHYKRLRFYCMILVKLTMKDDYGWILNNQPVINFELKDSTLAALEHFDDSAYLEILKTERLVLRKKDNPDFACVEYEIYLNNDNLKVGELSLKCNGFVEYKIYNDYLGNHYASEAIRKIVEVSKFKVFKMSVRQDDVLGQENAKLSSFSIAEKTENSYIYKYKKK